MIGGFAVIDVPTREEALAWAAKIALGGPGLSRRREHGLTPAPLTAYQ